MSAKKFPSFSQWKQIFKTMGEAERFTLLAFIGIAIISFGYLSVTFYLQHTKAAPAYGGTYTEGVVGQPRFINPIYGETDDTDRTLIDLVYSGLMTYDNNGKLVNDLVQNYQISSDGKTYTFQLKNNLYWQDGQPLTADDVLYTIQTIQDSDYKSPLRADWLDVGVQKISDTSFSLSLNSPYNAFLENCTLKIIPKHIWENVLPENFALSSYNLQPIGSGPYLVSSVNENNSGFIGSVGLTANRRYYSKMPYISNIYFDFFNDKDSLMKAINQKTVNGFAVASLDNDEAAAEKEIKQGWSENEKFNVYAFTLPRYFAVFFNTAQGKILSDNNITQGLSDAVDKQQLAQAISTSPNEKITLVNSPVLPDYYGFAAPTVTYDFNSAQANKLLDASGYKADSSGQRVKINNKKPAFQFTTYLKIGSKGNAVTELQGCLSRLDPSFATLLAGETNGVYGTETGDAVTAFQKKYLPTANPTGETGAGTRAELNQLCLSPQSNTLPLQFTLTTINQPQLLQVANMLKDDWKKVGVTVTIDAESLSDLKETIKNRDYDALLYGQALGSLPDLYPFWHSSQIYDPGLNLSEYQSKTADQLIESAREALDPTTEAQNYEQLQNVILKDAPALFLYNPDYLYWVSGKIKGIDTDNIVDPAKRFENIQNWYINTHRVWK